MATDPRIDEYRQQRQQDFDIGMKRGEDLFKEGSLGRLGDNQDIQTVLNRRRAQLGGFTPQEQEIMRSQTGAVSRAGTSNALRALQGAQASAGVRGAAAGAQKADIFNKANLANQENERQLQMANIAEARRGLSDLENTATNVGKFDLGLKNKEAFGRYSTALGEQMLGSADRGSITQQDIAWASARNNQDSGGKK
jgi:hypothetical protein